MFGLMTVARHEREMTKQEMQARAEIARQSEQVEIAKMNARIIGDCYEHWRALAERTQADMADLMRRQAPPLPGPEESEMGTIADDDHTPSAIAKREKAVGARN